MIKCTVLGCGGSLGVPQLLCKCYVCTSGKQRNVRLRASVLIESPTTSILIDTSPDFREQAYKYGVSKIDAIIYTHPHSDHIAGINDIRPFARPDKKIRVYMQRATQESMYGTFGYLFESSSQIYLSLLDGHVIEDYYSITIGDIPVETFLQHHGEITSLGVKVGNFAYSTDFNYLPQRSLDVLKNVDTWILDCLRYSWSPSHVCLEETLDYVEKVKPKRAILTHMAHEIDYDEISSILPPHIEPGYDGLVIENITT